ncbi:hypothetical protein A2U01_0059215, partial [Trifolium medium]|nr:hypothetical protein [Trifolium medium]
MMSQRSTPSHQFTTTAGSSSTVNATSSSSTANATTSFKTFSYDVYDPLVISPSNADFDANGSVEIICSSAKSLLSDDPIAQLDAMTKYARVLSIGSHALIDDVLE